MKEAKNTKKAKETKTQVNEKSSQKNKMTIEEGFERLESITESMQKSGTSLEELFTLYKEGCDIIKQCNEKIDLTEKEMIILQKEKGITEE